MGINYAKDAFRGRPFFVLFLVTDFGARDFGIYRIGRSSFLVPRSTLIANRSTYILQKDKYKYVTPSQTKDF